ncbi:hypothetical protein GE09DRAFT_1190136 [Coniochaeta sp. 2T2.1]|nr:hypothetical protein GE09DRAFT_1190136 [Coniochaeta sp. 2T2.1]
MSQPVRYRVMDDYTRTVNLQDPEAWACLNGNTALRPPLVEDGRGPWHREVRENINLPRDFVHLFHSPLPRDLPTTRKDNLIVMAAYEGNVDRYARLRRPAMVRNEEEAVIRGIYHSTMFAKYWSTEGEFPDFRFNQAITARFIMVNELSCIPERLDPGDIGDPMDLPHLIWHPLIPREETLRELIRRQPYQVYLRESVALACIAGNHPDTYRDLEVKPSMRLWQQATKSGNPYFRQDLRRRAAELGLQDAVGNDERYCEWYPQEARDLFPSTTILEPIQYTQGIVTEYMGGGAYERWETEANAARWELYIASSDEMRDLAEKDERGCVPLYEDLEGGKPWLWCLPWKNVKKLEGNAAEEKTAEESKAE